MLFVLRYPLWIYKWQEIEIKALHSLISSNIHSSTRYLGAGWGTELKDCETQFLPSDYAQSGQSYTGTVRTGAQVPRHRDERALTHVWVQVRAAKAFWSRRCLKWETEENRSFGGTDCTQWSVVGAERGGGWGEGKQGLWIGGWSHVLSVLGASVAVRIIPLVRLWAVVEDFNQGSGMMRFVFKRSSSGRGERPAQEEG